LERGKMIKGTTARLQQVILWPKVKDAVPNNAPKKDKIYEPSTKITYKPISNNKMPQKVRLLKSVLKTFISFSSMTLQLIILMKFMSIKVWNIIVLIVLQAIESASVSK
jgi:hypothetical protein